MTEPDPSAQDALHARVRHLSKNPKTVRCLILGRLAIVEYGKGVVLVFAKDRRILEMHLTDAEAWEVGEHLHGIYSR